MTHPQSAASTIDAFLGTDKSAWIQAGESPAAVASALVAELGPATGRDAEWTVEVLTEALTERLAYITPTHTGTDSQHGKITHWYRLAGETYGITTEHSEASTGPTAEGFQLVDSEGSPCPPEDAPILRAILGARRAG